jgi:hypothetical protein
MKPWKVQKFLGDVIYDLRNRNLLLVVVMLLIGIVAVPVVVSKSGSGDTASPVGLSAQVGAASTPESESAVVAYHPGIRNFKQRLNGLSAKDPFKQQFTATEATDAAAATSLDQVTSTSSSVPGQSTSSGGASGGSGGGGSGGGGGGGGGKTTTETRYTYYVTSVSTGESGGALAQVSNVSQFQFLPSVDKPVLVYLGTTSGGSQALFLVSKDVTSVGGNGTCFPTADACQLLGLSAGAGADMIYGPDGKTYHLQVDKIKRVTSSKPPV